MIVLFKKSKEIKKWTIYKLKENRIINKSIEYIKKDPFIIFTLVLFIILSVYWSYISILKFYALNDYFYDLGLAMEKGWAFIQDPISPVGLFVNPILWIIFPIFLFKSYPLLLAFQSMFITFGIFPLYGIAKNILKSKSSAFFIALSYLFFPMITGMYWYDFHYQTLFITLFFIAYYFFIKNRYLASFIFIILAGITRFPYIIFVILFSFVILVESIYNKKYQPEYYDKKILKFSIFLFIFSTLLFLFFMYIETLYFGHSTLTNQLGAHISETNNNPFIMLDNKIQVLTLIFFPFLGLFLFSKRFLILLLPFLYIEFFANTWPYFFPEIFQLQYAGLIVPFLYLGTIDAISNLFKNYKPGKIFKLKYIKIKKVLDPKFKLSLVILILVILLSTVYQPYGPLNKYSWHNYELSEEISVNWTKYNDLEHIVSLIPSNDPFVLTQNNIPEVYPRPIYYYSEYLAPMISGIYFSSNLTANKHYWNNINCRIDYVLADLNSSQYQASYGQGIPNMYNFTSLFYGSGNYGILAEASYIVLLERNYTGPVLYYRPIYREFSASSLVPGSVYNKNINSNLINGLIVAKNISANQVIFFGPGPNTNLPPGTYNITYQLKLSNISSSNRFLVQFTSNPTMAKGVILSSFVISGANFSKVNEWTNITFKATLDNFYPYLQFKLYAISNINGTLELKNVVVKQIGEPQRSPEFIVLKDIMSIVPENSTILAQPGLPSPVPELLTDYKSIQMNQVNNKSMPDYVLADLNSSQYQASYGQGIPNMYNFTSLFYGSGNYIIATESSAWSFLEKII